MNTLLGRLYFPRFSWAIQTLATDLSLGEVKKVLSLFFCYYGSKLLHNSPFFLNPTNYRQTPCLI